MFRGTTWRSKHSTRLKSTDVKTNPVSEELTLPANVTTDKVIKYSLNLTLWIESRQPIAEDGKIKIPAAWIILAVTLPSRSFFDWRKRLRIRSGVDVKCTHSEGGRKFVRCIMNRERRRLPQDWLSTED